MTAAESAPSAAVPRAGGLTIRGLRYQYGSRVALDGVDLDLPAGVLTGLLGPNGAGKTTLMRIVMGIIDPIAGSVEQAGRPVSAAGRRRWGYMPQERALYPGMRVGEQLEFFGRVRGLTRSDATTASRALADQLGLSDRWEDRTDKLSGGLQQRVQLATALLGDPVVVVLDEPFAGLDPLAVVELTEVLTATAAAGTTVLFSSHQLDLVQDLCDRIALIDQGRVVVEGSVAQLRSSWGRRQLRLTLADPEGPGVTEWLAGFPGVRVVEHSGGRLLLALPGDVDPLDVLDAARAAGRVLDFGLELPNLSEIFQTVVAKRGPAQSEAGARQAAGTQRGTP